MNSASTHCASGQDQETAAAHDLRFYFDGVQIGVALLEREQAEVGKRVALNDIERQADELLRTLDRLESERGGTKEYPA